MMRNPAIFSIFVLEGVVAVVVDGSGCGGDAGVAGDLDDGSQPVECGGG